MINIGLLGCGTIGGGVVRLLDMNGNDIERKIGAPLRVKWVLARTPKKARALGLKGDQITQSIDDIVNDPEIDIVVELMGGTTVAKDYIEKAIKAGKNVVTANKDLISRYGAELYQLAAENNIDLYYEASVGGGIPIIMPMRRTLAGNTINEMIGILNGTTNYMLTKMSMDGKSYNEALEEAQRLGYAEADPSSDVDGLDAGRKIAILAMLALHAKVTDEDVFCEGIRKLRKRDMRMAKKMGYVIKLLAVAKNHDEGIELGVYPAFISQKHPLASVNHAFNALFVKGDAVGDVMLYGQGAGAMPTASSVVGDIMQIARHRLTESLGRDNDLALWERKILPMEEVVHSFYISMTVLDQPNVLAAIAKAFGVHGVSIRSVSQQSSGSARAELVIITHDVKEACLRAALKQIEELREVDKVESVIRVVSELG